MNRVLKPCAHCGDAAKLVQTIDDTWMVTCVNDECKSNVGYFDGEEDALLAWGLRPPAQIGGLWADFDREWLEGSWSVGRSRPYDFTSYVHGHGTCANGSGKTPREAFDRAVAAFRAEYPDELTTKRKRLEKARAEAARLEQELGAAV